MRKKLVVDNILISQQAKQWFVCTRSLTPRRFDNISSHQPFVYKKGDQLFLNVVGKKRHSRLLY